MYFQIPRRHFVDANKRKLLKKPREQPKQYIVAQLNSAPSRHSPHAHASRKQVPLSPTVLVSLRVVHPASVRRWPVIAKKS